MLKTPQHQPPLWRTPTGFAAEHCLKCDLGWNRIGPSGGSLTVCLLDREPVLAEMTSCDRYEPKGGKPG